MKLSREQLAIIDEHINTYLIDKEKLIAYLEKHRIIKNEVFSKCAKRGRRLELYDEDFCGLLTSNKAYLPVNRDIFIRRIPFLFHCPAHNNNKYFSGLWNILPGATKEDNVEALESIYTDMEFMYYELHISMEDILSYPKSQIYRPRNPDLKKVGMLLGFLYNEDDEMFGVDGALNQRDIFKIWRHYLKLCKQLNNNDYFPQRLLTAYNFALEKVGAQPIIYKPLLKLGVAFFSRDVDEYTCVGNFPCDEHGVPILKWTNIAVSNEECITFDGTKSSVGTMRIKLKPNTTIHLYCKDNNDDKDVDANYSWQQIYAGPQNMTFNRKALKEIREACGFTQEEVAAAIGANVRTYQNWESSNPNGPTPNGYYLLRIMNWLQIEDVQDLIAYIPSTKASKFNS